MNKGDCGTVVALGHRQDFWDRLARYYTASGRTRLGRYCPALPIAYAGIAVFEQMRLVLSHKEGRRRILSLNGKHPIYREFRAVLLSIGAPRDAHALRDLARDSDFRIDKLFGKDLRTAVLLTLRAERSGEMDAASTCRSLPQHDSGKVRAALRRFDKIGVVTRRKWKTLAYYRLDDKYAHYEALQALLSAAIRYWPA